MFRLKATLVPTTVLRPWRTGWSVERGVDFSLATAAPPAPHAPAAGAAAPIAERACFIDEDETPRADDSLVRTFVRSAAAEAAEAAPGEVAEPTGMRAWWSLASKPPRT